MLAFSLGFREGVLGLGFRNAQVDDPPRGGGLGGLPPQLSADWWQNIVMNN